MSTNQKTKEQEIEQEATQDIPVLQVDESLDVEERLTDNIVDKTLPSRYLTKDSNGDVNETPEELFDRVADNVAKAEFELGDEETSEERYIEWKEAFARQMKEQRFMPNSPTLMNAGARLQQLSACISGDTPIYTENGLKRMDEVNEGDKVLTHSGQFKEVTAHWSNGVKETIDVKRGRSHGGNYSVTATPDHEFLTEEDGWEELQESGDAVQPVALPDVEVPDSFDLTKYTAVMGKDKPVVSDGGVLRVENSDDPRTGDYDEQYSEVVASVENSDAFAYLAGAYLAEGDVDGSDLRFTIGADEKGFENLITDALSELFDVHVAVMESSHGNWKTISASSPFIADFFVTQFGTGSTEKRIPKWVFAAPDTYQQSMLDGILDGDGYDDGSGWKLTLANPTLAYESSLLARNLGYQVNFTLRAENELSTNPTSRVRISQDSESSRFNEISKRSGDTVEVYDMEVADDHSFVAGDFIVHNCFVDSPEDVLENIAETEKEWTLVQKTGGGMGGSFSDLRPAGTLISTTKGTSSGPVSFMRKFNLVAGVIKQGGVRRGAQMAELRADHPDIGRFVVCKRNEGDYDNFNISVAITDEFIEAVKNDESYKLYSPRSSFDEQFEIVAATREFYSPNYQDAGPRDVHENLWRDYADTIEAWDWDEEETISFREKWEQYFAAADDIGKFDDGKKMELPARFIWDLILDGAWRNGEPGLFHLDETNRKHSFDVESGDDSKYAIKATNPCAEQPLCEYEACNLGHVNLSLILEEGAPTYDEWVQSVDYEYSTTQAAVYDYFEEAIDFDQLDNTVETGTRFLDNVVTQSEFPLEEIQDTVTAMRKIGLGVMGWAQLCYQMGLRYGEEESLQMGRILMNYIDQKATETSHHLAEERGVFKAWEDSKYASPQEHSEWFQNHAYQLADNWEDGFPMRNHNVTTVAPTGTTSMIGDTSGGIEPVYNVANYKNVGDDIRGDGMYVEFDSVFTKTLESSPEVDADEIQEIAEEQMEANEFDGVDGLPVPKWMKDTFITTEDVSAEEHGLMQRAFQEGVDSGISKTVNLPSEATHADVHDAYMLSVAEDEIGSVIKGLTVYRDQSRNKQVLTTQKHSDKDLKDYAEALREASDYDVEIEKLEEDE